MAGYIVNVSFSPSSPGSEEGGGEKSIIPQEKGIFQRLKEVFWKEEEEEEEGKRERQGGS